MFAQSRLCERLLPMCWERLAEMWGGELQGPKHGAQISPHDGPPPLKGLGRHLELAAVGKRVAQPRLGLD